MLELLDLYDIALLVIGLAALGVVGLPRLLADQPLSYPIIYVAAGAVFFALPLGFEAPDPIRLSEGTERFTEFGVIVALMGAGIGLSRPFGWSSWRTTWRLLGITMPLTIAAVAMLGWAALGLAPAAAILLGAVLAPTDPVLASDVQVPGPGEAAKKREEEDEDEEEDEVRFALSSEAGLNDGLAFPFVNLAILIAISGISPGDWWSEFLFVEVFYKVAVGIIAGLLVGRLLAFAIFDRRSPLQHTMDGMVALAATLISYAGAELVGGYGFLAVFVAAATIRRSEWKHEYHEAMHAFVDQIERLVTAVLLILFGGAVSAGVLSALEWLDVVVAVTIIVLVRPVIGWLSLFGTDAGRLERRAIAFFGIRGVGSFYYLAHAVNEVGFSSGDRLWAIVSMVVILSVVLHGVTATPAMRRLDELRAAS
ncbi:MAG TPA: cation:proton antiporter [Acidimicrobiia bacterium]|nr:cation:proton antiporter [Acidimicrobiia bacterium]